MQGKWQRIAGNSMQVFVAGLERRYAVHGGHGFDRDHRLREQTALSDNFVQLVPAFFLEHPSS
jgi:hypothetical protein